MSSFFEMINGVVIASSSIEVLSAAAGVAAG
jgi:hypothetical protein